MLYVSKREKDKWGIKDTETGLESFLSELEIREYLKQGNKIMGAMLLSDNRLGIGASLSYINKKDICKLKILKSDISIDIGLKLDIQEEDIIAKCPSFDYYKYKVSQPSSDSSIKVFTFPDIVTRLDRIFLSNLSDLDYEGTIILDLPSSLKVLDTVSLCDCFSGTSYLVVRFNSILDIIKFGTDIESTMYLSLESLSLNNNIIPVRVLEESALDIDYKDGIILKFPYTEEIGVEAISIVSLLNNGHSNRVAQFEFGSSLRVLDSFVYSSSYTLPIFNVVYLTDCSNLEKVSFSLKLRDTTCAYILVVRDDQFGILEKLLGECEISETTRVGVLRYRDDNDFKLLQSNMTDYIRNASKYFKSFFDSSVYGSYKEFELIDFE